MREEFREHIRMRTEDLVRTGLTRSEAERRAHREFGHVETHRAAARASRGLAWVDQIRFSWIDVKLGLRMMVKHPGLTLVAVFALAVGIPTGMAPAHLAEALDRPLPEDPDNRIRAIRFWNSGSGILALPTWGDFLLLRDELEAFDLLGAYAGSERYNVASEDGRATPVLGAEVTASVFAMLGTPPLLGRTLDAADERPGAPDVVVLGHDLWHSRFGADPGIVGTTLRVGRDPHTVVGVMPADFRFPLDDRVWLPLRDGPSTEAGEGRQVRIVGRLARGLDDRDAQAELTALQLPPTHPSRVSTDPRPLEVVPFSYTYVGLPRAGMSSLPEYHFMRLLGLVLLLVACGNVAMLVFARTATRFRELAVRSALGAGRARLVAQVFTEALVLAVASAGLGIFVVDRAVGAVPWHLIAGEMSIPYWVDLGASAAVLPPALALAVVSATVAGVLPALFITRGDIRGSIRAAEAGRSGIRFGGGTSALIVADVALAVGVIGFGVGIARHMTRISASDEMVGIPAREYLAVELRLSANELTEADGTRTGEAVERFAALQETLAERLTAEPAVRSVVFADALPRMNHRSRRARLDGELEAEPGRWVRVARVDIGFFDALGHAVLAGRDFDRSDAEAELPPVIVNTVFVEEVLGGEEPLGRRVRLAYGEDAPAHEIVGVVPHLGLNTVSRTGDPGVYIPGAPGTIHPIQLGMHIGPDPERFVPRLREIVAESDPSAIVGTPVVLSRVQQGDWYIVIAITAGLGLLVGILLALAASGIYAIMSFSVSERTREIGIRAALGASRAELARTILRRTAAQLAVGGLLGIPLATFFLLQIQDQNAGSDATTESFVLAVGLGLAATGAVALFSCVAPTRRALRIEANEALRAEG